MKHDRIKFESSSIRRAVQTQQRVGATLLFQSFSCFYTEMSINRAVMGETLSDPDFIRLSFGHWRGKINKKLIGRDFRLRPDDGVSGWMLPEFIGDQVQFHAVVGFDRKHDPDEMQKLMRRCWRLVSEKGSFNSASVSSLSQLEGECAPAFMLKFLKGKAPGFGFFKGT